MSTYIQTVRGAFARPGSPAELGVLGDGFVEQGSMPDDLAKVHQEVPNLPFDRPRTAHRTNRTAQQTWSVPDTLLERLRVLGDQNHATLIEVLLSGNQALLHRYTGSPEVVTGALVSRQDLRVRIALMSQATRRSEDRWLKSARASGKRAPMMGSERSIWKDALAAVRRTK